MRIFNCILFVLIFNQLFSQGWGFTIDQINSFENVSFGAVEFSDIDGDEDLDLLLTGSDINDDTVIFLYENDGNGVFSIRSNNFSGVTYGAIAFADVDGDGDEDVLICGRPNDELSSSILYLNDGNGNFIISSNTSFAPISQGSIAFADVDNDNDQDLIISGLSFNSNTTEPITRLYFNDGVGNFSEVESSIVGLMASTVAFADVDNDLDKDLMITGFINWNEPQTKLYNNDGFGNFTESTKNHFFQMGSKGLDFADIDGDQDLDLCITGSSDSSTPSTKLYFNDGNGKFSEDTMSGLIDLRDGSVNFIELTGDNDLDLILTGWDGKKEVTKTYINIGEGKFWDPNASFLGLQFGDVAVGDVDGDLDSDFIAIGSWFTMPRNFLYLTSYDPPTNIFEQDLNSKYKVYPNPVTHTLHIETFSHSTTEFDIFVYNSIGQLKLKKKINENSNIDISTLSEGHYTVEVLQNGNKVGQEIIVVLK